MTAPFLKTAVSKGLTISQHSKNQFFSLMQKLNRGKNKKVVSSIKLYDAKTIEECPWPQTAEGDYAKSFILPLMTEGVPNYVGNIQTHLKVLIWGDLVLPITINENEYDNSYVCSPYSFYVSYAKKSLSQIAQPWAHPFIHGLLAGMSALFCRYQINRVVTVNNWLFSTNLYPHLTAEQIQTIAQFLQEKFPEHAIVFRSLDQYTNPLNYQALQQIGYHFIASREIFLINPQETTLFESRLFKSDLRLLNNSGYEIIDGNELSPEDIPRLLALYQDLYISKHSGLNPQFTLKFLKLVHEKKLMDFKVLKKEGKIDGVVGMIQCRGIMLCPFLGYDLEVPKEAALYRLLSTVLMLEAKKKQLLFHQSSGASMFKKIRKAIPCIEYTAVYYQKLPIPRRLPWWVLKKVCNSIGVFYMRRY